MKNLLKRDSLRVIALLAIAISTIHQSIAQQNKPAASGYAPVNGIQVYYEIYGEGLPIVLLHGSSDFIFKLMNIPGNRARAQGTGGPTISNC